MKNKSQLQETSDARYYYLKHKDSKNEYDFFVVESFIYETKRGDVFPCQYSRKGAQWIRLFDKDKLLIHQRRNYHVYESTSARKTEIYNFLKPLLNLRNFESVLLNVDILETYSHDKSSNTL